MEDSMKLFALGIAAFTLIGVTTGLPVAHAQQNVCEANPSPVDASDPSVVVAEPAANAGVSSPLHVEGQARVFEATVSLTLYDEDGDEIAAGTTNAAEGGVLSDFSTDLPFTAATNTPACLWVFEVSAQDGSPVNVVQVPLTLNATGLPPTGSGPEATSTALSAVVVVLGITGLTLAGAALALRRRT
jgi:hypothetical protein